MKSKIIFTSLITVLLIFASLSADAEQKKTLGNWEVHYMALPTTFLSPEVAKANNIQRSKSRYLVNISVLDKRSKKAQAVEMTGNARNLLGTSKPLEFKKVEEGDAIYYLATVNIDDKETLRFSIDINQGKVNQQLKFQQLMYED